jgi:23S rRNA (guanosine2251-2'-O)-methyltransferase
MLHRERSPGQGSSGHGRLVVGLQPVREAVRVHQSAVGRVAVQRGDSGRLRALARFARDQGVARVELLSRQELDRLSGGVSHQGAAAWVPELRLANLEQVLSRPELLCVALDGVQDPQNFGAVVRSAVALTRASVLWGEHCSAPLSLAMFRASAGAIEHAELCRVRSLAGALRQARTCNVQVVGLDPRAAVRLRQVDLRGPSIVVVGGEHEGLRRAVRHSCSLLASLVAPAAIDSLNASVAAGLALYEATVQRG